MALACSWCVEAAPRTGLGEEVGSELGGDGLAALGFAVGARVTIIGDHGRDGARAGALACVDGD